MSYILDALNKSEKERERKETPNFKFKNDNVPQNNFQPRHFFFLLIILVAANSLGVLAYFWTDLTSNKNISKTELSSTEVPKSISKDGETIISAEQTFSLYGLPAEKTVTVIKNANRYDGKAMAPNVEPKLPEITITSHIYASDSDLRMVNINGYSRKEGDFISDSLVLTEITDSGVLLEFYGEPFEINIVEDWLLDL